MPNFAYSRYLASGSKLTFKGWCADQHLVKANAAKRKMGWYLPLRHTVHYVRLTSIPVPEAVRSLKDLTRERDCVWVRSLQVAKTMVEVDRAAGGEGSFTTFEIRSCKVCGRTLLGAEAEAYRKRCRWPSHRWYWPWGPCCNAICKPAPHKAEEAKRAGLTMPERNRAEYSL